MADVLIPSLMIGDCSERICVRASRFWDFYDPQNEPILLHSDLVLIDEEGNSIHAQIYPQLIADFRPLIKEGSVYNITYFRVKKSNLFYNPVSNDVMINFTKWTSMEEIIEIPPAFPMYTYSLTPIEQVHTRIDYKEHYTDTVGVITSISSVASQRTRGRQADSLKRIIVIRSASSNAPVNVLLWGERATSFPGDQLCKDGQTSPQVIIFVGTLVKNYADGLCLSGGSSCKWYINPNVPEAENLMASTRSVQQPIKWNQLLTSSEPTVAAEEKKISYIKCLHPFKNKKKEFLVTVTIRKIDNSWWYNSCKKCLHRAKPLGDSYKCINPKCSTIGMPVQRYKLCVIAGDETGDTEFILFGRMAQRLTKKSVDTLIATNPTGFIPDEITKLLGKVFIWNVSFSDNTIESGNVCFQVNAVIAEVDAGNALLPMSPAGSQQSSLVLSQDASSSMQNTPQKGGTLALPSPPLTPQSGKGAIEDKITPQKSTNLSLLSPGLTSEPVISPPTPVDQPPEAPQDNDTTDVHRISMDLKVDASMPAGSSTTKAQKSSTRKRTRASPTKKTAKKLFVDEAGDTTDEGCADDTAKPSANKNA